MFRKMGIILSDFFSTVKKIEIVDLLIIPGFITIIIYLFFNSNIRDLSKFIGEFNDIVINITSLLAAFGLASLSILATSSSENISVAKERFTNRTDRSKKLITYYQLLVLRNFYSLFLQLTLLIISVLNKFIIETNNNKITLYLEVYLLICSIFAQIFVVNSMYFLFINPKKNDNKNNDE
ncbi:hypothetical protein [Clostridium tetani]|uniref:hypothetical protein n=1 Tax=Clostridium tetani TaxID=1513 RepID=UPI002952FF14|nr:hypothetical protein [Clostridium tetani]BDR64039.1 hypothetical protein K134307016_09730 [Clostridium tetani]BDR78034.1 hypothetical protein K154307017_09670 [Clostridium tetani]